MPPTVDEDDSSTRTATRDALRGRCSCPYQPGNVISLIRPVANCSGGVAGKVREILQFSSPWKINVEGGKKLILD